MQMPPKSKVEHWLPIALCCAPGVALIAIVTLSIVVGGVSLRGPLGVGLLVLAALACPLSMGVMAWRATRRSPTSDRSALDCCAPDHQPAMVESERLSALRARREAVEREILALQGKN